MNMHYIFWAMVSYAIGLILFTAIGLIMLHFKVNLYIYMLFAVCMCMDFNKIEDIYDWIMARNLRHNIYLYHL